MNKSKVDPATIITIPLEKQDFGVQHTHLPYPPGACGGAPITLCGWTDVPYKEHSPSTPVSCPVCRKIVSYCRTVRNSWTCDNRRAK